MLEGAEFGLVSRAPRQVGGCPSQDLVLLLQQPITTLQLPQLDRLRASRTGSVAVLHVSALQPVRRHDSLIPKSLPI